jgi:hypothetical protein
MPRINALSTVRHATLCMKECKDTVAEALQICGPERTEWEDKARELTDECRAWERFAGRMGWTQAEQHCSSMAAICEQQLWRLT